MPARDMDDQGTPEPVPITKRPPLLASYLELATAVNTAAESEWSMLAQRLAFVEASLGLYHEAVRHFPLNENLRVRGALPTSATHRATDAAEAISTLAAQRRIVMVNEAHHDVATRRLTLELLQRLRAIGFTHFAVEALNADDRGLQARGYPTETSGYYINEPVFGEIVREALRLGYRIVEYEYRGTDKAQQARETGQARNIQQRVFATDPGARLFVHAGYAHVDKAKGRLWNAEPMAMRLAAMSGITPLSIDQTELRSAGVARESAPTKALIEAFAPRRPVVLLGLADSSPWSANPDAHDVSVLLPRPALDEARPDWLDLEGRRKPWPIDIEHCAGIRPCLISAQHAGEADDAVAADRYAFVDSVTATSLFLRPGRYRLGVTDSEGRALARMRTITVR